ncbi:MAG: HEAT repeat domain-containing protein [Planctomycetes bacterium]|nr:HEAT repeat domain-containing protein [Planctomycetota bacterium]
MNSQPRQNLDDVSGVRAGALLVCALMLWTLPAARVRANDVAWIDLDQLTDAELIERYRRATKFEFSRKYDYAQAMIERDVAAFVPVAREDLAHGDRRTRCVAGLILARAGHDDGLHLVLDELAAVSGPPPAPGSRREQQRRLMMRTSERYFALLILGLIGDDRAVPALIAATRDPTVDYQAAISLGQIGAAGAVPALRELAAARPDERHWAGYALARIGEDEGYDLLFDVLRSDMRWSEHRHAINSLGELGDDRAVPILSRVLAEADVHLRVAAARALGAIGSSTAVPALLAALEDTETVSNESVTVAEVAAEAIATIDAPRP